MQEKGNEVSQTQKRICSWAMLCALVVAFVLISMDEKAIAKGLVLGTIFSVINFVLLAKFIPLTLGKSRARASFIGFISILSRYAILAIPLIWAIKSASFNFVAAVVGIFSVQVVTLFDFMIVRPLLENRIH